jgi:phosphopantetheine adenylyltransferase
METVFMMASPEHSVLRASGVRESAAFGGCGVIMVPPAVARRLAEVYPPRSKA